VVVSDRPPKGRWRFVALEPGAKNGKDRPRDDRQQTITHGRKNPYMEAFVAIES
jgi:hypothetical protein